ncbi:hypothetical protein LSTR_LSTR014692 [Laodelphax striatellus]|uniref:Uncharacterized protein n=1 Tax=Laodelphax striatellus TaxID=195883 RepID=A0A482WH57_LAOST|nr:hypothetical protein LSTR_LSTR014692 [Laodelphax striatellus]
MEDQQKVEDKEEESIIIATADTQLVAEATASMEAEESLELHQDDSGGSFCLDNGAAAASSYDSHQGHIYRAGISSDRLLDMRKSPTKEQLVHMIENLNKKIAKYENEHDAVCTSASQHKNELLENPGKKLTFAVNAICVIEMKDENCAHIRVETGC